MRSLTLADAALLAPLVTAGVGGGGYDPSLALGLGGGLLDAGTNPLVTFAASAGTGSVLAAPLGAPPAPASRQASLALLAAAPRRAPLLAEAAGPSPAPPAPGSTASQAPVSPGTVAMLLRRGDEMMALGDYSGARRLYERAAAAGSAPGARGVARTYDPAVVGRENPMADPAAAATWYAKAATPGDAEAAAQLEQLKRER